MQRPTFLKHLLPAVGLVGLLLTVPAQAADTSAQQ